MTLREIQLAQGAVLAPDQIPLHFGDQQAEYTAALEQAVLLDRSHEARLDLTGKTTVDLLHRISTNDLHGLAVGEDRATILTNPNARIIDRIEVIQQTERLLVLGEPGRGQPLRAYLQRNIFFGDDVHISDLAVHTHQFDLHGPQAAVILGRIWPECSELDVYRGLTVTHGGAAIEVVRRKPVHEQRWTLIVPTTAAAELWSALVAAGAQPAGSLIYHVLRVRAGLPSVGRELSERFIPLEVGLWDEVSFTKGCYTGQEIIARMESRNRLAKTLVRLKLSAPVETPANLLVEGRTVGQLTSVATAPDGEVFALGVVKPDLAQSGQALEIGPQHIPAQIEGLAEGARHAPL